MTAGDDIKHAGMGFDLVFSNDLDAAKTHLASGESPFHLMGLGCIVFLQAALGMETGLLAEASRLLTSAESKAKKEAKAAKTNSQTRRFASGLDFEVLQADAILLLGLTQALSESYTGYLQCMYSLNSAHTKFEKIYRTAFPEGIDKFATPSSTPIPSRQPSLLDVPRSSGASATLLTPLQSSASCGNFFSRWGASSSKPPSRATTPLAMEPDGPVEELIIAGAAFGYGLFNLVLSLLPGKVKSRGVVGFFGFNSDRRLALQALGVAATKDDSHAVFAGLALMSYHGAVLLLSGYQADEAHILKQYKAIVDKLQGKYPSGSLWILHSAKISRMSYDPDGAISILQAGLAQDSSHRFVQADALLVFDLAWTLLAQRRYLESADMFLKMTELNTWSHATYYFIAAGCHLSLGNLAQAKALLDRVPQALERRKVGGRELPTEAFIRKKIAFYKQKQTRRGSEADYVESIRISIAEEMGLFWNVHDRITLSSAKAQIRVWTALSPPVNIDTPYASSPQTPLNKPPLDNGHLDDLDTPDELAIRSLLVGVIHRSISHFEEARIFLLDVAKHHVEAKWISALALFELAVLHLKAAEASDKTDADAPDAEPPSDHSKTLWKDVLKEATELLDRASEASANTDLSARLDSRISLLRGEIMLKRKRVFGE